MGHPALAQLESLLRARKLDVTLTSARPWSDAPRNVAATGVPSIDDGLGGGLARGHVSELIGARSSGRTGVMCRMLAAAAARGEAVALIDPCDRFDPASATLMGLDMSMLLWVRLSAHHQAPGRPRVVNGPEAHEAVRALKAVNLVLQAGGFGLVAFDLADVPPVQIRQFPQTTWMRMARVIEGSQTAMLILGTSRITRSAGGATITLGASSSGHWSGQAPRARLLRGIHHSSSFVSSR